MARPIAAAAESGSAAIEAAVVASLIWALASTVLLALYLIFAGAWLDFQSEQALYCVAEARPAAVCKRQLEERARRFLPWGGVSAAAYGGNEWLVEVKWSWRDFAIQRRKRLSIEAILANRDLHW